MSKSKGDDEFLSQAVSQEKFGPAQNLAMAASAAFVTLIPAYLYVTIFSMEFWSHLPLFLIGTIVFTVPIYLAYQKQYRKVRARLSPSSNSRFDRSDAMATTAAIKEYQAKNKLSYQAAEEALQASLYAQVSQRCLGYSVTVVNFLFLLLFTIAHILSPSDGFTNYAIALLVGALGTFLTASSRARRH